MVTALVVCLVIQNYMMVRKVGSSTMICVKVLVLKSTLFIKTKAQSSGNILSSKRLVS
jgi:hypothetical protein